MLATETAKMTENGSTVLMSMENQFGINNFNAF